MQGLKLSQVAALCGATLEGDPELVVSGPASLREAGPSEVSFLAQARYAPQLAATRAAAVIVRPDVVAPRPDLALLRTADPNGAFTAVIQAFAEEPPAPAPGVHASAVVHPEARLGRDVSVGPLCVVGRGAELGDGCVLHAQVHVGPLATVGPGTVLHPGVVLYHGVRVGARCLLHAGVVLGADGFGFEPTPSGWEKVPQCGTVEVGDDVELGANTSVDRARFGVTRVGSGAKLDNLVQVGHNCVVEEGALICAQTGLAGSTRVGAGAVLGGQVAVNGHLEIGPRAQVGARSGVSGDLEGGKEYFGTPALPARLGIKVFTSFKRLPELLDRVRELEARLAELEQRARG